MQSPAISEAEKRALVRRMAKIGMPEYQIAFGLSISISILRLFYGAAIQYAEIEVNLEILESLQRLARSKKSPTATIFWARTRCGFGAGNKTTNADPAEPLPPGGIVVLGPNGERLERR